MPNQNSDTRANLVKYVSFILNRRPYFRHQLREKLILRSRKLELADSKEIIESILDDLSKSGYLNDEYLAQAFVRRQLAKGYGPRFIRLKLQALKLSPDNISLALEQEADLPAQIKSASHYLSKKRYPDTRKAMATIYRRGFDTRVAQRLFDSELSED